MEQTGENFKTDGIAGASQTGFFSQNNVNQQQTTALGDMSGGKDDILEQVESIFDQRADIIKEKINE
jgi:hypothetical protein